MEDDGKELIFVFLIGAVLIGALVLAKVLFL